MIIISIDPQVKKSAGAFHYWQGGQTLKPLAVGMFNTDCFIQKHADVLWGYLADIIVPSMLMTCKEKIAIIEGQYVGVNPKGALALCKAANRMAGALLANGFKVFEAPVFGKNSWIKETLHLHHRQKRAENKKISIRLAKEIWPIIVNSDEADAVNLAQWWWARNKFNYLGK